MTDHEQPQSPDVPLSIHEAFLATLEEKGIASEVIVRLRKTLIEKPDLTEEALRAAVHGEGTLS